MSEAIRGQERSSTVDMWLWRLVPYHEGAKTAQREASFSFGRVSCSSKDPNGCCLPSSAQSALTRHVSTSTVRASGTLWQTPCCLGCRPSWQIASLLSRQFRSFPPQGSAPSHIWDVALEDPRPSWLTPAPAGNRA